MVNGLFEYVCIRLYIEFHVLNTRLGRSLSGELLAD